MVRKNLKEKNSEKGKRWKGGNTESKWRTEGRKRQKQEVTNRENKGEKKKQKKQKKEIKETKEEKKEK